MIPSQPLAATNIVATIGLLLGSFSESLQAGGRLRLRFVGRFAFAGSSEVIRPTSVTRDNAVDKRPVNRYEGASF